MAEGGKTSFDEFYDYARSRQITEQIERDLIALDSQFSKFAKNITGFGDIFRKSLNETTASMKANTEAMKQLDKTQIASVDSIVALTKQNEQYAKVGKQYAATNKSMDESLKVLGNSVNDQKKRIELLKQEFNSLDPSVEKNKQRLAQLSSELIKAQKAVNEMSKATRDSNNVLNRAAGSYNALTAAIAEDVNRLKQIPGALDKNSAAYRQNRSEIEQLQRSIRTNTDALKVFDAQMGRNFRNVGNYTSALGTLGRTASSFASAFGFVGGVFLFAELTKNTYELIKQNEVLDRSLRQVTGSAEQYRTELAFIRRLSNDYGVDLNTLTDSYIKFLASSKGTNLEGEQSRLIFDKVTKSAASLGLSVADTEGVLKALGQIMSKGKVQSEELRGQLGDRLPGAFNIMAKALGVTTAELDKMLKLGQIMSDEALPKFAVELEKAFGADKIRQVNTLTAEQTRLENAWVSFIKSLEDGQGPIANALKGFIGAVTEAIKLMTLFSGPIEKQTDAQYLLAKAHEEGIKTIDEFYNKYRKDIEDFPVEDQKAIWKEVDQFFKVVDTGATDAEIALAKFNKEKEEFLKANEGKELLDLFDVSVSDSESDLFAAERSIEKQIEKQIKDATDAAKEAIEKLDTPSLESIVERLILGETPESIIEEQKKALEDALAVGEEFDKKELRKLEEKERLKQEIIRGTFDVINAFSATFFENEQVRFDNELTALSDQKERELELAGNNARAREAIEKDFENRRKQIQNEQAEAQRKATLFNLALKIPEAIITGLITGGPPLALIYGSVATAQLIAASAIDVPSFAEGTDNAPGGAVIVNDRRRGSGVARETITTPSGKRFFFDTDKPVMTDMIPKGSKIDPRDVSELTNVSDLIKDYSPIAGQHDRLLEGFKIKDMLAEINVTNTTNIDYDRLAKMIAQQIPQSQNFLIEDGTIKKYTLKGKTKKIVGTVDVLKGHKILGEVNKIKRNLGIE